MRLPNSEGTTGAARPCDDAKAGHERGRMRKPPAKPTEQECPACNGTGYPVVMQPVQPGRKIYPAPCKKCGGKGRTTEDAN
jgi:DnaJ-class molecular chaperone